MEIDFWFDFSCPYCYPAAMLIEEMAHARKLKVNWQGFVLAPIATQGPQSAFNGLHPQRIQYTCTDLNRLCRDHGLPFLRPSHFPDSSLLATRISCWYQLHPWLPDFVRSILHAAYAEDCNIGDDRVVAKCIDQVGQDPRAIIDQGNSMEARARLQLQNQQAIRMGVFDAPFFFVQQEPFCGLDRMITALDWSKKQPVQCRQHGVA